MARSILEVSGIGPATAKILANHGIHSADDLAGAPLSTIMAVPGFSETRGSLAIVAAKAILGEAPAASVPKPSKKKLKTSEKSAKKKVKKDKPVKAKAEKKSKKFKTDKSKKKNKKTKKDKKNKKSDKKK